MANSIVSYRIKECFLVLFASILALGSWNPFVPIDFDADENSGFSIAQFATIVFICYLFFNKSKSKKITPRGNKYAILFAILLFLTTIITSSNTLVLSELVLFIKLALCISLVYLIPSNYSDNKLAIYRCFFYFAIVSSVITLLCLTGFLGDILVNINGRVRLIGENPNTTGRRMALAIFIIIYIVIENPFKWGVARFLNLIAVFPLLTILLGGGSRGALIMLICIVIFYFMFRAKSSIINRIVLISIFLLFGLFIGSNILETNTDFAIMERMTEKDGNSTRSKLNEQTLEVYLNNNLLVGSGTIHYKEEMMRMFRQHLPSHNMYIYIIAVSGLVGFLLFCLFLFDIIRKCWRCRKADIFPAVLFIFTFLFSSESGGVLAYLLMWFIWATIIALTNSIQSVK